MIRESMLYRILSAIHIVFFSSLLCFGTICLSGTVLLMPALAASFLLGKDAIYKELDINDSIIKIYFKYLKNSMKLVKYFLVNIIIALNISGMVTAAKTYNFIYYVICLAIVAFLLSFILYIAGYYTFVSNQINMMEVVVSMSMKLQLLLPVFIVIVLCVFFFSDVLLMMLFLAGTFILFALEILIFIQMLYLKKVLGKLDANEEYAYLVN